MEYDLTITTHSTTCRDQGEYVDNYSNEKRNLYSVGKCISYVYNRVQKTFATSYHDTLCIMHCFNSHLLLSSSYISGFGDLYYGGEEVSELRHVELAFVPRSTCNSNYTGEIFDSMMCAADPSQDTCRGDSGGKLQRSLRLCLPFDHRFIERLPHVIFFVLGPLYDADNGALVGIVSWGYGCADPRYPGVYAQVSTAVSNSLVLRMMNYIL